jgi:NAD(P)-dependent dehydrogenase (short-subunit alcohol dehydrogenase family)
MRPVFRDDVLQDKRALVTGASRGIGAEIARTLAALGASVVLASNDPDGMASVREEIGSTGATAEAVEIDLTDRTRVAELGRNTEPDILVNNAAPDQRPFPLVDAGDDLFELQFALNFFAPLTLIKAVAPRMAARGGGSVISISSMAASRPAPRIAPYACSKAALEILTRISAMEFAPQNVRFNAIAPATVRTQRVAPLLADEEFVANALRRIPMGRFAEVTDVAMAAAWLASDASSFVTGQVITVDGGSLAGSFFAPPVAKQPE